MNGRKGSATKEDLKNFKEEILHQFHVIFGGVVDHVKQVAEGVATVNEGLDRIRKELKEEIENLDSCFRRNDETRTFAIE